MLFFLRPLLNARRPLLNNRGAGQQFYFDMCDVSGDLTYKGKCIPPPEYEGWTLLSWVAEQNWTDPVYNDEFLVVPEDFTISWEGWIWAYPNSLLCKLPLQGSDN